MPVSVTGDTTDHGGTLIGAGFKLLGTGLDAVIDFQIFECPIHGTQSVIAGYHKLSYDLFYVAAVGDLTTCGAVIIGPGCLKLLVP